jgi:hypothetical protein
VNRLGVAIALRLEVHKALDADDIMEVCRTNTIADRAVADLSPEEMWLYMQWCRQFIPADVTFYRRGDA